MLSMKSQDTEPAPRRARATGRPRHPHRLRAERGGKRTPHVAPLRERARHVRDNGGRGVLEPGVVHHPQPAVHGASCDLGRVPPGYDGIDERFASDLQAANIRSSACETSWHASTRKLVSNLDQRARSRERTRGALRASSAERANAEASAAFAAAGIVGARRSGRSRGAMRFADVPGVLASGRFDVAEPDPRCRQRSRRTTSTVRSCCSGVCTGSPRRSTRCCSGSRCGWSWKNVRRERSRSPNSRRLSSARADPRRAGMAATRTKARPVGDNR